MWDYHNMNYLPTNNVHIIIQFNTYYRSYKVKGVFLDEETASLKLANILNNQYTTGPGRVSTRKSLGSVNIYTKDENDYWIKVLKIGEVDQDVYLTHP